MFCLLWSGVGSEIGQRVGNLRDKVQEEMSNVQTKCGVGAVNCSSCSCKTS